MQRIFKGDVDNAGNCDELPYFDHAIYQFSHDNGVTFDAEKVVKYETGADFDPEHWDNEEYLLKNMQYSGYNFTFNDNNELIYSAISSLSHEQDGIRETVGGVRIFKGKWNGSDYDWRNPAKLTLPLSISGRGLMEPFLVRLADGTLFIEIRISVDYVRGNWAEKRRYYSYSKDGGESWAPARPLCFDDDVMLNSSSTLSLE